MAWLKEEGFGGIMIWSVDMDDFRGSCGAGKYPLIKAMKKELLDYSVKLEYDGPYETGVRGGKYTTKNRKLHFKSFELLHWIWHLYIHSGSIWPQAFFIVLSSSLFFLSEWGHLWRGRQSHIVSQGSEWLHDVLHVRGWEKASHAMSGESGVQPERERLRLAGKRRRLSAPHPNTTSLKPKNVSLPSQNEKKKREMKCIFCRRKQKKMHRWGIEFQRHGKTSLEIDFLLSLFLLLFFRFFNFYFYWQIGRLEKISSMSEFESIGGALDRQYEKDYEG